MDTEAARLPNGSRFEDRYEILRKLGAGSLGRVYHARQLSTGQPVVIKLLSVHEGTDESAGWEADRFRRETRICADLSHTNIVGPIDFGQTKDGRLYAVVAHVPGETLEQKLSRDRALSVRESIRLMTQVLEALEYGHAKGIVHRDLEPSNLMLSGTPPRRNAVVLDFGLGRLAEGRRRQEWQTRTQTRGGHRLGELLETVTAREVERAIQASANEEAVGHLRRALELLGTLPETRERDEQELALQRAIAGPLSGARGWSDPECELVHRGLRHRRPEGRQGAARGAELNRARHLEGPKDMKHTPSMPTR